jgi:hypothetical protein
MEGEFKTTKQKKGRVSGRIWKEESLKDIDTKLRTRYER